VEPTLQAKEYYEFGPYRLDLHARVLLRDGAIVALTPKVLDMLVVLVKNAGQPVSKDELLRTVWPDAFVEESNLTQNISVLRKALAQPPDNGHYIETIPKRGYRFLAEVRRTQAPFAAAQNGASRGSQSPTIPTPRIARPWTVAILAILIAASASAFWFYRQRLPRAAPTIRSIAVLPFVNLTGGQDTEYFSDGLTEEVMATLSSVDGLKVAARPTVFQFKGKAQDVRAIGRQIGADAILDGSVRREGNRVRISAHLSRVEDGFDYWSRTYERDLRDVFELQQQLARDIARTIGSVTAAPSVRSTQDPEAHDFYLRGCFYRSKVDLDDLNRAIKYFEEAVAKDPGYATAWSELADSYTSKAYGGWMPAREAFTKAREMAGRALELDPSLAAAHTSMAGIRLFYDWDFSGAEQEFQTAIRLNPSYPEAHHWYSHLLVAAGRFEEALAQMQRATELDPLDPRIAGHMVWHYFFARQYDAAIAAGQHALDLDSHHVPNLQYLQFAYERAGRYREAADAAVRQGLPSGWTSTLQAAIERDGARGYWKTWLARVKADPEASAMIRAKHYAHAGLTEDAFRELERAYRERESLMIYLKQDQDFDSLRSDPRLSGLIQRVGIP
jgi:TolB-like protein/DNA-binding winged helix-turn-helix (wHTH) protein/Flp pilus assembly protein TadD